MVKEIQIKAKTISGIIGLKKFKDDPYNSADLKIETISLSPYMISLKTEGIIGEAMQKDDPKALRSQGYLYFLNILLRSKFRLKKNVDYEAELL
jgi:hypothetical protein